MQTEQSPIESSQQERKARRILRATAIIFVGILILALLSLPKVALKAPLKLSSLVTRETVSPPEGFLKVLKVVDGDTIVVLREGRRQTVRLIGMDTPEVVDPRKTVQCFGREASNKAHELLDGSNVRLELDPSQGEIDKYGRLLAYVFMQNGQNYNELMIESGYAHEYTYQSQPYKYQEQFKQAEVVARDNSRGLWANETCAGDTKQPAK